MADKVRVGIIGVGQQGERHVRAYRELADVEIVAVADLREEVAQRVAQQYDVPLALTDYRQLLARDDVDSVDVVVHNRLHKAITVEALRAGKHVYVEKPMLWSYREAKEMHETARALGKKLHVQLAQLYTPATRGARRLIEAGHLGTIYYAKSSHYRRRGRPFVDGYGSAAFVDSSTSGGGALIDSGVYTISRMLFLLGNPKVVSVSGSTHQMLTNMYEERRRASGYDVEELATGFARLEGGITFFVEQAWAIHSDNPKADYVYGSDGGLRLDPLTYFTTLGDMEMDGTFDTERADVRWRSCDPTEADRASSARHWIAAQLGRVPLIDTAGLALNTAFLSDGVYLSSRRGREVTADEIETAEPDPVRV
jgi:predicted dehydrogenase